MLSDSALFNTITHIHKHKHCQNMLLQIQCSSQHAHYNKLHDSAPPKKILLLINIPCSAVKQLTKSCFCKDEHVGKVHPHPIWLALEVKVKNAACQTAGHISLLPSAQSCYLYLIQMSNHYNFKPNLLNRHLMNYLFHLLWSVLWMSVSYRLVCPVFFINNSWWPLLRNRHKPQNKGLASCVVSLIVLLIWELI